MKSLAQPFYTTVLCLLLTAMTASAQTDDNLSDIAKLKDLPKGKIVKIDSKIRQELKQEVTSLTYKNDGTRLIRLAPSIKSNTITKPERLSPKTKQTLTSDATPNAATDQIEYAVSCNPLGLPTSIDETYGVPAKGRKEITTKTDSGIIFKAHEKPSADRIKKLERIAELTCVEPEIK